MTAPTATTEAILPPAARLAALATEITDRANEANRILNAMTTAEVGDITAPRHHVGSIQVSAAELRRHVAAMPTELSK